MHTIKLKVKDSIYSHLIYLLKNLNQKEIEIIEDNEIMNKQSSENDIKDTELSPLTLNSFKGLLKGSPTFEGEPLEIQQRMRDEWS